MSKTITVTYNGNVLTPKKPLDLEINREYQIEIVSFEQNSEKPKKNAWDILEELAGTCHAPEDWSNEHDHYLYGTPKTSDK